MRRSLLLSALVVASALVLKPVAAAAQPLPRLPKMVWELYLQEEYQACGVAYGIYARLPEAERARLHAGTKIPLDASTLTRDQARVLADWFNSARWGCDPPAEKLDANAVGGSTIVFKCEDSVVEFCLQSPGQKIWKKLTIACAPERAEWVRDGVPLWPSWYSWYEEPWDGGIRPPTLPSNSVVRRSWEILRPAYRVYAELSPGSLRRLHQEGEVRFAFLDLPRDYQDRVAAIHEVIAVAGNRAFGYPPEFNLWPDLRRQHFGITKVVFSYRRDFPDNRRESAQYLGPNPFPRPHRAVFLQIDPLFSKEVVGDRAEAELGRFADRIVLVAWPPELQRRALAYKRASKDWYKRWRYTKDGKQHNRAGAPPNPTLEDFLR